MVGADSCPPRAHQRYNRVVHEPDPDAADAPRNLAGDSAARADLRRIAEQHSDAVWSPDGAAAGGRAKVPGVLSGDVGAKGAIAHELQSLSRSAGRSGERVPYGTTVPGAGRYLLLAMLGLAGLALAAAAALVWVLS